MAKAKNKTDKLTVLARATLWIPGILGWGMIWICRA
jgi:hypothetical protein